MKIIPISLKNANEFIGRYHRHNKPTSGGKFALGCIDDNGILIGVGIGGRPVSRMLDNGTVFEITRVCTDGTFNSSSFIYGRMVKIAKLMGYEKVITYTLTTESGASMRAIGAKLVAETKSGQTWNCKSRPREEQQIFKEIKYRWEL